jgi:phosphoglycolate phosphatase-like HAD superfamily hydrolase
MELRPGFSPHPRATHVVFDFDGTLSWLRHGWPETMCEIFLRYYPRRADESESEVRQELVAEILSTNGQPSIVQMEKFVQRAHTRQAKVPTPRELLQQYQDRLDQMIAQRSESVSRKQAHADEFVVWGARAMLDLLQERGLQLTVLSGTLESRVKEEAELLDLSRYFGGRIYGSPVAPGGFSKRAVLDKIMADGRLRGEQLICFGDGPVEIFHARELGGLAVAVASDENHNGSGQMDPLKRSQLLEAGAHVIVADYRDAPALARALFHE